MKKVKKEEVVTLVDGKFLKFYNIPNGKNPDGSNRYWSCASRNDIDNLVCVTGIPVVSTISVVPMFVDKDGDEAIILNKEERILTAGDVYSFVSGCVEPGQTIEEACYAELEQEIGAKRESVTDLQPITGITYKSEGLTDETAIIYEAHIKKLSKQHLEDTEKIKVVKVKLKNLKEFMQGKMFSTPAATYLTMSVRMYELRHEFENKNEP